MAFEDEHLNGSKISHGKEEVTEVKKLQNLLNSFQEPERKFNLSGGSKVTAFRFDQKNQNLYLGFKNGEVGLLDFIKIEIIRFIQRVYGIF